MGFLWLLSLCRVRTRRPAQVVARYVDVFMVSLVKLWPMGDLLLLSLSRVRTRRPAQVVEVKGRGERSCRLVRWRLSGVTGHIVADGFPMATFASRGTMLTSFWCQC